MFLTAENVSETPPFKLCPGEDLHLVVHLRGLNDFYGHTYLLSPAAVQGPRSLHTASRAFLSSVSSLQRAPCSCPRGAYMCVRRGHIGGSNGVDDGTQETIF